MLLIDTSAWIEYFRATGSPAAVEVRRLLTEHADRVVMCEPIAMEILAGAVDDEKHAMLEQLVNGLPSLAIDDAVDFRAAAAIYRSSCPATRPGNCPSPRPPSRPSSTR